MSPDSLPPARCDFSHARKGNGLFKEKPSTKAVFPFSRGKNRISQGVEHRGSLISVPLALREELKSPLIDSFPTLILTFWTPGPGTHVQRRFQLCAQRAQELLWGDWRFASRNGFQGGCCSGMLWPLFNLVGDWVLYTTNCVKHVRSNSVPSQLLSNSCLLNPGRGPKSNRTSRLFPVTVVFSKGKATNFVRTRGFSKLTRFRNTENLVNPFFFWTWTWLKHFRYTSNARGCCPCCRSALAVYKSQGP